MDIPAADRRGRSRPAPVGTGTAAAVWPALQHVDEVIRLTDAKAAAILAASLVLEVVLVRAIPTPADLRAEPVRAVLALVAVAAAATGSLCSLLALRPRRGGRASVSVLSFSGVARQFGDAEADFVDRLLRVAADDGRMAREVAGQVWVAHRIADAKVRAVSCAVVALGAALAAGGAAAGLSGLG